jgi:hypothetical protein
VEKDESDSLTAEFAEHTEKKDRQGRSAKAGLGQKIIFDFTPETRFSEAKNGERQKIGVEQRYIAANDDGFF